MVLSLSYCLSALGDDFPFSGDDFFPDPSNVQTVTEYFSFPGVEITQFTKTAVIPAYSGAPSLITAYNEVITVSTFPGGESIWRTERRVITVDLSATAPGIFFDKETTLETEIVVVDDMGVPVAPASPEGPTVFPENELYFGALNMPPSTEIDPEKTGLEPYPLISAP